MGRLMTGVDVVELARFRRFVQDASADQLQTIFTAGELQALQERADAIPGLAARFAAKEAVIKALTTVAGFALDWQEIEIVGRSGVPEVKLHGAVAVLARESGVVELALSMTHSRNVAIAQVVGTRSAGISCRCDDASPRQAEEAR
jgi:holo-[acyl-carrier protein] synthase